jgi:hypothetical protein
MVQSPRAKCVCIVGYLYPNIWVPVAGLRTKKAMLHSIKVSTAWEWEMKWEGATLQLFPSAWLRLAGFGYITTYLKGRVCRARDKSPYDAFPAPLFLPGLTEEKTTTDCPSNRGYAHAVHVSRNFNNSSWRWHVLPRVLRVVPLVRRVRLRVPQLLLLEP